MFVREKTSGPHTYLQIVENRREGGKTRQRVVASLGRVETLLASGALDRLIRSACRFSEKVVALAEDRGRSGEAVAESRSIGPGLVFERLWRTTGCHEVLRAALAGRRFRFDVERAVFLTVLHRLFHTESGSDRDAGSWQRDYGIEGVDEVGLHHLYRAMAWLGEALPGQPEGEASPRCVKDLLEEQLFARRRTLFSRDALVFFDTTSVFFTGEGGSRLGERGFSKDHRPECRQLVLGMVLDRDGRPVCSEVWPGNTSDVSTLARVARRLEERFGMLRVCVVADAGMISRKVVGKLEAMGWDYILGTGLRRTAEVKNRVLADPEPFEVVAWTPRRQKRNGEVREPEPKLEVKEVVVKTTRPDGSILSNRYVVCRNPIQARREAASRADLVQKLPGMLRDQGAKTLLKNRAVARLLKARKGAYVLNREELGEAPKYDGIWVLRTNTELDVKDVALRYKQLWMVERTFRTAKSLLDTRPVFHQTDAAIRGHMFCSFLALTLHQALLERLEQAELRESWNDIVRDLRAVTETEIEQDHKRLAVRSRITETAAGVFRAVGLRIPPVIRQLPRRTDPNGTHASGNDAPATPRNPPKCGATDSRHKP